MNIKIAKYRYYKELVIFFFKAGNGDSLQIYIHVFKKSVLLFYISTSITIFSFLIKNKGWKMITTFFLLCVSELMCSEIFREKMKLFEIIKLFEIK